MKEIAATMAAAILFCVAGCDGKARPNTSARANEQAKALAIEMRAEMMKPAIMELPAGPTADTGRGRRQRELAQPLMYELMACGQAAETPIWELLNDENESVRRTTIWMMGIKNEWKDDKGNRIDDQTIVELHIPLMERALNADDPQVRWWACIGLGDYADSFSGCLDRLFDSLAAIERLKDDQNNDVKSAADVVYRHILLRVSKHAHNVEIRNQAATKLDSLGDETSDRQ